MAAISRHLTNEARGIRDKSACGTTRTVTAALLRLTAITCLVMTGCEQSPTPQNTGDLATLAASAEAYRQASPGTRLAFPQDHGAHSAYRIEWWYLTANLQGSDGRPYGAQWTLFRIAQRPPANAKTQTDVADKGATSKANKNPWQDPQVYMAHFAITTPDDHVAFQRYARGGRHGGRARAGANGAPFEAWIDDWTLRSKKSTASSTADSTGPNAWLPLQVRARNGDYSLDLNLSSDRPLLLQGVDGFSQKHPNGGGSHYYSHPFLKADGTLEVAGKTVRVRGDAWLDREWSSQFLQTDQSGWDWFALHLDSGEKLMLFRLRESSGDGVNFRHGVLISPTGAKQALRPEDIRFDVIESTRVAGRNIPTSWHIGLATLKREITVKALHPYQWMTLDFPYWEGYVTATGASSGESGRGYLEMVGYTPIE